METIEQILQSIAELRIAQKESHRELAEQMKATDVRMAKLHAETEEFFKASDARFEARLEKSRLEEAEKHRIDDEKRRIDNEKRRIDDERQRVDDEKRRVEWQERTLEFDKEMKELAASQKETNKQLGGIGNSNGAYAEIFFINL